MLNLIRGSKGSELIFRLPNLFPWLKAGKYLISLQASKDHNHCSPSKNFKSISEYDTVELAIMNKNGNLLPQEELAQILPTNLYSIFNDGNIAGNVLVSKAKEIVEFIKSN